MTPDPATPVRKLSLDLACRRRGKLPHLFRWTAKVPDDAAIARYDALLRDVLRMLRLHGFTPSGDSEVPALPGSVFEIVDATSDEQYFPLAIFLTLEEALAAIAVEDPNAIGCHDHEDWDNWCKVEIRERKIGGWCAHGKRVACVEWQSTYDEANDEFKWARVHRPDTQAQPTRDDLGAEPTDESLAWAESKLCPPLAQANSLPLYPWPPSTFDVEQALKWADKLTHRRETGEEAMACVLAWEIRRLKRMPCKLVAADLTSRTITLELPLPGTPRGMQLGETVFISEANAEAEVTRNKGSE